MNKEAKHAMLMALAWTVTSVSAWIVLFTGRMGGLQIFFSILATVDAVLWWLQYTKKRQEEISHE